MKEKMDWAINISTRKLKQDLQGISSCIYCEIDGFSGIPSLYICSKCGNDVCETHIEWEFKKMCVKCFRADFKNSLVKNQSNIAV